MNENTTPRDQAIQAIKRALDELMPIEDDVFNKAEQLADVAEAALKLKIHHLSVKIVFTHVGQM